MNESPDGLSNKSEVEALADQLTAFANALHARIKRDVKAGAALPDGPARAQALAAAQALLDDEQLLRQRANSLYADAASTVVRGLGVSQQHLLALAADASEKIRKINLVGNVAGLVAGMLALAGGVASGQPTAILAALDTIRKQAGAVKADQAARPG